MSRIEICKKASFSLFSTFGLGKISIQQILLRFFFEKVAWVAIKMFHALGTISALVRLPFCLR